MSPRVKRRVGSGAARPAPARGDAWSSRAPSTSVTGAPRGGARAAPARTDTSSTRAPSWQRQYLDEARHIPPVPCFGREERLVLRAGTGRRSTTPTSRRRRATPGAFGRMFAGSAQKNTGYAVGAEHIASIAARISKSVAVRRVPQSRMKGQEVRVGGARRPRVARPAAVATSVAIPLGAQRRHPLRGGRCSASAPILEQRDRRALVPR